MTKEITATENVSSRRHIALSKRVLTVLALAFVVVVVGLTWFWLRSASEARVTCDAQYNALVNQAKTDLVKGDRPAAINSLKDARNKLRECETPTAKDVAPIWRN